MEKKIWTAPRAEVEQFMANEYVAACGDDNKIYYFECDAPRGTLYYYPQGDGNVDGVYNGNGWAIKLGSYNPCHRRHDAPTTDVFYDGFIDYNSNGLHDAGEGVIVWRGRWNNDGHATAQLDMNQWQSAKS